MSENKRMKSYKKFLSFILIFILIFVSGACSAKKEEPQELALMNRCAAYIEEFSTASPADALELKAVSDDCKAALEPNVFDEYYEQSAFRKNSVISGREDEYKESHRCEIMMLRLKCLLLSGEFDAFKTEFSAYIKLIDSNSFTFRRFPEFFKNDTDLVLSEEQLAAVVSAYRETEDACVNDIEKYIICNEEYVFVSAYSDDEALKEKLFNKFSGIKDAMGSDAFEKHYNEWKGFAF